MNRDDLLGLAGGGNKTRKLEFLMADALKQGADTVITCGAVQSNHCRLTVAAAAKEGLKCRLVLEQRVPGSYDRNAGGNNFLFHLLGVEDVYPAEGGSDVAAAMERVADKLTGEGRKPYVIPGGGSNETGALGYVACAQEILQQSFEQGVRFDAVVLASGSAGTHAGTLTGILGNNACGGHRYQPQKGTSNRRRSRLDSKTFREARNRPLSLSFAKGRDRVRRLHRRGVWPA